MSRRRRSRRQLTTVLPSPSLYLASTSPAFLKEDESFGFRIVCSNCFGSKDSYESVSRFFGTLQSCSFAERCRAERLNAARVMFGASPFCSEMAQPAAADRNRPFLPTNEKLGVSAWWQGRGRRR